MSGFTVPFSSSPPSTPGNHSSYTNGNGPSFSNFGPNPSTTPAGPPPSSTRSFTPAGAPPSSVFGSSQLGPGNTLSQPKPRFNPKTGSQRSSNNPTFRIFGSNKPPSSRFKSSPLRGTIKDRANTPKAPSGRLRPSVASRGSASSEEDLDEDKDDEEDDEEEEEEEEEEEDVGEMDERRIESDMDIDSNMGNNLLETGHTTTPSKENLQFPGIYEWKDHGFSVNGRPPGSIKGSRTSVTLPPDSSRQGNVQSAKKNDSTIPLLSRNFAKQMGHSVLDEPDDLILETEELINQLYTEDSSSQDQETDHQLLRTALTVVPEALSKLWQSCCNKEKQQSPREHEFVTGIGPREDESTLQKANFLSALLLQLHHPPAAKGKQALAESRPKRSSLRSSFVRPPEAPPKPKSYPSILLDWLETYHNPYRTVLSDIRSHYPDSTAHTGFWDVIFSSTLRGKLTEIIQIFKDADFKHAWTAREDGHSESGYMSGYLIITNRMISRAVQLLESCPAQHDGDWNVVGHDWMIFRKRAEQALSDLTSFAEGRDRDLDPAESIFEAENFGIRSTPKALSRSVRRAESKVPWSIYQNLKVFYGILLGGTTEIISVSQNWVEAAIGLTVWWDGSDDNEIAVGSLAVTRQSLRQSQSQTLRSVDANTSGAYLRRLAYACERVTDSSHGEAFHINPMNPVEVGLASIFEGDVEGILGLLRAWSMPIAAACVEIATVAGWFESTRGAGIVDGFDESDLMVLSYGQPEKGGLNKDGILVDYAQMLFGRQTLKDVKSETVKEGWELSMQLLTRLDDTTTANLQVGQLLGRLTLHSDQRADKMIGICRAFGLDREAAEISEVRNSDYSTRAFADMIGRDTLTPLLKTLTDMEQP